ncbi:hypothetical protein EV182_003532, partial [Spiromyces aspiralis]
MSDHTGLPHILGDLGAQQQQQQQQLSHRQSLEISAPLNAGQQISRHRTINLGDTDKFLDNGAAMLQSLTSSASVSSARTVRPWVNLDAQSGALQIPDNVLALRSSASQSSMFVPLSPMKLQHRHSQGSTKANRHHHHNHRHHHHHRHHRHLKPSSQQGSSVAQSVRIKRQLSTPLYNGPEHQSLNSKCPSLRAMDRSSTANPSASREGGADAHTVNEDSKRAMDSEVWMLADASGLRRSMSCSPRLSETGPARSEPVAKSAAAPTMSFGAKRALHLSLNSQISNEGGGNYHNKSKSGGLLPVGNGSITVGIGAGFRESKALGGKIRVSSMPPAMIRGQLPRELASLAMPSPKKLHYATPLNRSLSATAN